MTEIAAGICPRTGEPCSWRTLCESQVSIFETRKSNVQKIDNNIAGKYLKMIGRILPLDVLGIPNQTAEPICQAQSEIDTREAILALNCERDDTCIVREAMVAQGLHELSHVSGGDE
jgi:hypothetical protein